MHGSDTETSSVPAGLIQQHAAIGTTVNFKTDALRGLSGLEHFCKIVFQTAIFWFHWQQFGLCGGIIFSGAVQVAGVFGQAEVFDTKEFCRAEEAYRLHIFLAIGEMGMDMRI